MAQKEQEMKQNTQVLITGANRGIGLEFCKQLLFRKYKVVACCRNPQKAHHLSQLHKKYNHLLSIDKLDVSNETNINELAERYKNITIDILILNAGIKGEQNHLDENSGKKITNCLGSLNQTNLLNVINVNAIGSVLIAQALFPNIISSKRKQIIAMSSGFASIGDNESGGSVAYRISKCALNMAMQEIKVKGKPHGVHVMCLAPGWVQTDMGGNNARLTVTESVSAMLNVVDDYANRKSGGFYLYNGKEFPW